MPRNKARTVLTWACTPHQHPSSLTHHASIHCLCSNLLVSRISSRRETRGARSRDSNDRLCQIGACVLASFSCPVLVHVGDTLRFAIFHDFDLPQSSMFLRIQSLGLQAPLVSSSLVVASSPPPSQTHQGLRPDTSR
ncbi:hypothetical protein FALCPG4_008886 [Fusarium falciforme]